MGYVAWSSIRRASALRVHKSWRRGLNAAPAVVMAPCRGAVHSTVHSAERCALPCRERRIISEALAGGAACWILEEFSSRILICNVSWLAEVKGP